jgi:hypothetical protein
MNMQTRIIALTLGGWIALGSSAHAQTQSANSGRATVTWTIGGAGAGFGVGLWAGLSAFDDAINSDRKVWTSAVVGAAFGAVGGYLIGKSRARGSRSSTSACVAGAPNDGARASYGSDRILPQVRSLSQLGMFRAPVMDLDLGRSGETTRWYSDGIDSSRFRCRPQGP